MLTVCCVWVQANVPYSVEYVTRLHAMCRKWIDRPFRFVCFTDRPWLLPPLIDTSIIRNPKGLCGWWSKVQVFDVTRQIEGRILYLDLDSIIVNRLDAILDFRAPFALVPHAGTFEGRNGLAVVKRFNSSVMIWNAGTHGKLFANWTPKVAARLWGDQDWIGEQCPEAAIMPASWFPRISEIHVLGPAPEAKVVLCKKPKNTEAVKRWEWARQAWEAA